MPSLEALLGSPIEVAAVVTNPDRPAGRGMATRTPPVKRRAQEAGVEVLQPERATDPELAPKLERLAPDVATVVAYGRLLPGALLAIPVLGFVNLHFSLLPAYRGAAPVQRAVVDGASTTGVSVIVLSEAMDEGPLLATEEVAIAPGETAGAVGERLAHIGARLLVPTLEAYGAGALRPRPQDHGRATYAPKITPDEARIEWDQTSQRVHNLVRGLNPAPGAWTTFRSTRLKVLEVTRAPGSNGLAPGALAPDGDPLVGTADGALALRRVQPAGRRAMPGAEWLRGIRLRPGDRFE